VILVALTVCCNAWAEDKSLLGKDLVDGLGSELPPAVLPVQAEPSGLANEIAVAQLLKAIERLTKLEDGIEKRDVRRLLFTTLAQLDGVRLITCLEEHDEILPSFALRACAEHDLDRVWDYITSKSDLDDDQLFDQMRFIHDLIDWMPFADLERYHPKVQALPESVREFARQALETRENAVIAALNPEKLKGDSDFRHSLKGATFTVGNIDMKPPAMPVMVFEEDGVPLKEGSIAIGSFVQAPDPLIALGDLNAIKGAFRQFGCTLPVGFNKVPGLYISPVTSIVEDSVFMGALFYTVIGNAATIRESDRLFIYRHFDVDTGVLLTNAGQVLLGAKAKGKVMGENFTGFSLVALKPAS